ncbi:MAG: DUF547 domain-containing protein, partial [Myxococcota bacterium]
SYSQVAGGIRRIDYEAALPERARLDSYVARLQGTAPLTLNRDEQRAYWINLYNAETIRVILDHYPVESIKDINLEGSGLFGGPWNAPRLKVNGEALSLNNIEHGILRPLWADPRIHYAVNCASLGCPNLAAEAYTAANSETLLEAQARDFVAHPRGVAIDEDGDVRLSNIYLWYRKDFGMSDREVLDHVATYASPERAAQLKAADSIDSYDYDWRLNNPTNAYK